MGNDLFLSFFSPTAVGICALVVLGLTIFALQTKIDFTMCNGILFVLVLCLMIFGIFCAIFPSNIMNVVYASLGAVIFSCYIVVDTQLMMGGKHKYNLDPEEYVFASLNLYLDIINLFLMILSLVGDRNWRWTHFAWNSLVNKQTSFQILIVW